ncbi:MAG TPA: DUF481 domain-containing protein [Anaerolineales bacterium]|nr:DUF481 domain-containing protein [Anaerolineales bacterium]
MKKVILSIAVTFLLVTAVVAVAAEKYAKSWSDQGEFLLVDTSGNSKATTLAFKNELKYAFNPNLKGSWKIGVLYGESNNQKNAESYSTDLKLDYLIDAKTYGYGVAGWLKNTFAGLDPRYMVGGGVGYKFLTGPDHALIGEAGLGYTSDNYVDNAKHDYLNGRLFGKYTYDFTPKNSFSQSIEYLYDFSRSDNYNLISETALIAALTDVLSMKASYTINYANAPTPDTIKNTDKILGISLVVNF